MLKSFNEVIDFVKSFQIKIYNNLKVKFFPSRCIENTSSSQARRPKAKFSDISTFLFFITSIYGLHILSRDRNGVFQVSKIKVLILLTLHISGVIIICVQIKDIPATVSWKTAYSVPLKFSTLYYTICLYNTFAKRKLLKNYLNHVKDLHVHKNKRIQLFLGLSTISVIMISYSYAILIYDNYKASDGGSYFMFGLQAFLLETSLIVPASFDLYYCLLASPIRFLMLDLKRKAHNSSVTDNCLQEIYKIWYKTKNIQLMHEEVSYT